LPSGESFHLQIRKSSRAARGATVAASSLALTLLLGLPGCGGGDTASGASVPAETALSAQAALGEKIFADVSLSASGRQACASCHS